MKQVQSDAGIPQLVSPSQMSKGVHHGEEDIMWLSW